MPFFVYILKCRTGHFYTGYTNNVSRRLAEHNLGVASKFTRSRRPVSIVHSEKYRTRLKAMRREITIKKMTRKGKIRLFTKIEE